MSPLGLTFLRITGATVLFWIVGLFFKLEVPEKKDLPRIVLAAFFGVFMNQMLFLKGLNFTNPIEASIIMTINPVVVLVFSALLIKEKITWIKLLGIVIGASGAILLISNGGKVDFSSQNFLGNLMMFFNASSYGIYLVIVKPLMKKYHPMTVMRYVFLSGLFFITPFGFKEFAVTNWSQIPWSILLSIIYVVAFTTALAYLLNVFGLKEVRATVVSVYIYSQPVIASLVAIFAGKDTLSAIKIISTLLVFIGVYFVSRPQKPLTGLLKQTQSVEPSV